MNPLKIWLAAGVIAVQSLGAWAADATPPPSLAETCRQAAIKAVAAEEQRVKGWLEHAAADPQRSGQYQAQLQELEKEKAALTDMKPDAYPLPEKRSIAHGQIKNGQITYWGQSKSGPFYHVLSMAPAVKTEKEYAVLEVYLVKKRSYFGAIEDYYVHVGAAE